MSANIEAPTAPQNPRLCNRLLPFHLYLCTSSSCPARRGSYKDSKRVPWGKSCAEGSFRGFLRSSRKRRSHHRRSHRRSHKEGYSEEDRPTRPQETAVAAKKTTTRKRKVNSDDEEYCPKQKGKGEDSGEENEEESDEDEGESEEEDDDQSSAEPSLEDAEEDNGTLSSGARSFDPEEEDDTDDGIPVDPPAPRVAIVLPLPPRNSSPVSLSPSTLNPRASTP